MSHHDKVQRLIAELGTHGIRPLSVVPPIYSWLWRLGVLLPPPHCQRWPGLLTLTFANFAPMFLVLTLIWQWRSPALPDWVIWALPLAGGVVFGLLLTAAYRYAAAILGLPNWKEYPRDDTIAAAGPVSPWVRCDAWVRLLLAAVIFAVLAAAVAAVP